METFTIVLRGYDRAAVDQLLEQAYSAIASDDDAQRRDARAALESACFDLKFRGYDRAEVERTVAEALRRLN